MESKKTLNSQNKLELLLIFRCDNCILILNGSYFLEIYVELFVVNKNMSAICFFKISSGVKVVGIDKQECLCFDNC